MYAVSMKLIVVGALSIGAIVLLLTGAQSTRGAGGARVVVPGLTRDGISTVLPPGVWGGIGVRLDVLQGGGAIEFDCAHGTVTGSLTVEPDGTFRWSGTYTRESGGPTTGEELAVPATYSGSVTGAQLALVVDAPGANVSAMFELTEGSAGRVLKCL